MMEYISTPQICFSIAVYLSHRIILTKVQLAKNNNFLILHFFVSLWVCMGSQFKWESICIRTGHAWHRTCASTGTEGQPTATAATTTTYEQVSTSSLKVISY